MFLCKPFAGLAFVCIALSYAEPTEALYSGADKVKVLTARNFRHFVIETELPAMVEFYAPWVGSTALSLYILTTSLLVRAADLI